MRSRMIALLLMILASSGLIFGCGKELPTRGGDATGRVVMAELFTTTWCGWCPDAERAMDRLFEEETPAKLAVIHWHTSIGQGDPFSIPEADERAGKYAAFIGNPPGFPVCVFDGVAHLRGGWQGLYDDYRETYESEAALGSSLSMDLDPQVAGNRASVAVTIAPQSTFTAGAYDLVVAAAEHEAVAGRDTTSYVARRAKTESITLSPERIDVLNVELELEPEWKRDDLWIVAFVQEQQPAPGRLYSEVMQAAMAPLIGVNEDFYAFLLTAPDTTRSLAIGGETLAGFALRNTGTLDDTLTISVPTELAEIPAGWSISVMHANAEIPLPARLPLAAGESISASLRVTAPTEDTALAKLVVGSDGDPSLADTLGFQFESGTYGVRLSADDTEIDAREGVLTAAPFTVSNTGTIEDDVVIDLPQAMQDVPDGWQIKVADPLGNVLALPYRHELPAGGTLALVLRIMASSQGTAAVELTAVSGRDPSLSEGLDFTIRARTYNVDLESDQAQWQIVVGSPTVMGFRITNTGGRDDLIDIDLDTSDAPGDWAIELVYEGETVLPTPYRLLIEAGNTVSGFAVRVTAAGRGQGAIRVIAESAGDPLLQEVLEFHVAADAYGIDLAAPGGTDISLSPGTPAWARIDVSNTGSLADTLTVDLPEEGLELPAGWTAILTDADSIALGTETQAVLNPGASRALFLRVDGESSGSGTVQVRAVSLGLPSLSESLTFSVSASPYAFEVIAETDIHVEEYGVGTFAPYRVTNTGSASDTYRMVAPVELQQAPLDWGPAVLCVEGTCYPPGWTLETTLPSGESDERYYVDWVVPGPGTGIVRLVVTSVGHPALTDTLTFTYTGTKAALR